MRRRSLLLLPLAVLACSPHRTETPTTTVANDAAAATPSADALAARAVVTRYFALIAHGDYAGARLLWDHDGADSGGDATAFARTFARYAGYRPNVGAPTAVKTTDGVEYVNVAVRVHVKLAGDGREFDQQGPVMLRRPAASGSGTAANREWRIWGVDIRRPH